MADETKDPLSNEFEHPEDRAMRLRAQRDAARWIGPFWRREWRRFVALVQTYADGDAEEALHRLRQDFWSKTRAKSGPPPKGAR